MSEAKEYRQEIMDAAHSERIKLALSRAITSYRNNVNEALRRFPHTVEMAKEVQKIKSNAVANMDKLAPAGLRVNRIQPRQSLYCQNRR